MDAGHLPMLEKGCVPCCAHTPSAFPPLNFILGQKHTRSQACARKERSPTMAQQKSAEAHAFFYIPDYIESERDGIRRKNIVVIYNKTALPSRLCPKCFAKTDAKSSRMRGSSSRRVAFFYARIRATSGFSMVSPLPSLFLLLSSEAPVSMTFCII